MMTNPNRGFVLLLTTLLIIAGLPVHAQFITLARKIKSKLSDGKEITTVVLDAGASKVYHAVIDTLSKDKLCRITNREDARMFVAFSRSEISLTMDVDSLSPGYSQVSVQVENPKNSEQKPTDPAVKAILAVCHKVGLQCTVKDVEQGNPK